MAAGCGEAVVSSRNFVCETDRDCLSDFVCLPAAGGTTTCQRVGSSPDVSDVDTRLDTVEMDATTDAEHGFTSAEVRLDLVGRQGSAITSLRPAGVAMIGDERVDVVSQSEWIEAGSEVEVISSEGYRHVVRLVT